VRAVSKGSVVAIDIKDEITALDQLLAILARAGETAEVEIAKEHLEAARWYLLGAMSAEYSFSLSLADKKLELIPNPEIREKAMVVIAKLRQILHSDSLLFLGRKTTQRRSRLQV
jgi:hypothetical protein